MDAPNIHNDSHSESSPDQQAAFEQPYITPVPETQLTHPSAPEKKFLGMNPIKVVFAMEYVLQGLANPFQGITYQPFFKHFRVDYGLNEAATQKFFANSYLAWSFKPLIGFLIDAYGKTKVILTMLLGAAVLFYLLIPVLDVTATVFFWLVFTLSIFLAATDVAVDRATVIAGDEESKSTGKSKSTTVGLNQSICWAAIYGTGILAAVSGGYVADHFSNDLMMYVLSLVPLAVLIVVFFLPKDQAVPVPIKESIYHFWQGLNTGPILWVIVFYFLFHFQPAMGALWNNHLIENLHFSQTQIGLSDGATYVGYFFGVLLFATYGVRWQDRFGLKFIFKAFIILSIIISLTQYVLVDPWFTQITTFIHTFLPFLDIETVRLGFMATYNSILALFLSFIRMSTFSLVGAVIPVNAAGSLFAGFMSVANLAYSFCYSSGAWLYTNGLNYGFLRAIQEKVFGLPAMPGAEMSIHLLLLIGSGAYLLSFAAVHMLPNRRQTLTITDDPEYLVGPEHYLRLGQNFIYNVNIMTIIGMVGLFALSFFVWDFDAITCVLFAFFGVTFLRKVYLDWMYKRMTRTSPDAKQASNK